MHTMDNDQATHRSWKRLALVCLVVGQPTRAFAPASFLQNAASLNQAGSACTPPTGTRACERRRERAVIKRYPSSAPGVRRRSRLRMAGEQEGSRETRRQGDDRSGGVATEGGGRGPQQEETKGGKGLDIVNPFKKAFDAGRDLRQSLATALESITGTASPVRCSCG